jgi:hypothetical protein
MSPLDRSKEGRQGPSPVSGESPERTSREGSPMSLEALIFDDNFKQSQGTCMVVHRGKMH